MIITMWMLDLAFQLTGSSKNLMRVNSISRMLHYTTKNILVSSFIESSISCRMTISRTGAAKLFLKYRCVSRFQLFCTQV